MEQLTEVQEVTQHAGEPRRRWFTSRELDLIAWLDDDGCPAGFQLCYDRGRGEKALSWSPEGGYSHAVVDDGETASAPPKMTPILVADGPVDFQRLDELFRSASSELPAAIRDFVAEKLTA